MRFRVLLVTMLLCASSSRAQALEHDVQSWSLFAGQGSFTKKARWYAEAQPRIGTNVSRFERLLLRGAVGFQVSGALSLWLGYAWTPLFSPAFRDEQRPFQQALVEHTLGEVTLVNRTRLEERFIAATAGPSFRVRHLLRALWRIPNGAGFGLAVGDELFLTLNSTAGGPPGGFDQNRAMAAVNWKHGPLQLELGYTNVLLRRGDAVPLKLLHVAMVMVIWTMPGTLMEDSTVRP